MLIRITIELSSECQYSDAKKVDYEIYYNGSYHIEEGTCEGHFQKWGAVGLCSNVQTKRLCCNACAQHTDENSSNYNDNDNDSLDYVNEIDMLF